MKKIINILTAFSLLFVACNQEFEEQTPAIDVDGEGVLTLSCSMSQTRSTEVDEINAELLAKSTLKIYKSDGDLIRYYSPATDMPSELYLVAGSYSASLTVNATGNIATSLSDCSYYGEQDFTIVAGETQAVTLTSKLVNSAVKVVYDDTIATNFEEGFLTYVSAQDSFSLSDAQTDSETTLRYTESATGYFILPEGVSNLAWGFYGTHTDSEVGDIASSGVILSPKEATLYTLTLKYSKTAGGFVSIYVTVDESAVEYENNFVFSPQPTVTATDFSSSTTQTYVEGNSYNYSITSINEMSSIEVQLLNEDKSVVGSLYPFVGGAEVEIDGAVYEIIDSKSGTLEISDDLFSQFPTGGVKYINVVASDIVSGKGELSAPFKLSGLLADPTVDLWNNTAQLQAMITSEVSGDVVISYRKDGSEDWIDFAASSLGDGVYQANVAPTWVASNNENSTSPTTVYSMTSGVTAGNTFEYRYSVDGVVQSEYSFTTSAGHTIPYSGMEEYISCFGESNSSSTSWASGNNSMASSLCSQSTFSGMSGYCAKLAASDVLLVNIAAGSLCLGQFNQSGMNGTVSFGQAFDWQSRPTTFKYKYNATIGTVNASYHSGSPLSKGDQDMARVYFAIVDWSSRHDVTSGTSTPSGMWDPATSSSVDEGKIIGYASEYITASTSGVTESELTVYYYDTDIKPSSNITIVVSFSTSAYGDYLTGCNTNVLYVDDFELGY